MEDDSLANIAILLILIMLNALIALSYAALTNVRPSALREQAEQGSRRAKQVLRLLDASTNLQLTYRVSALLIQLVLAALTIITFGQSLHLTLGANIPPLLPYLLVLLPLGVVILIVGEFVPASIGSRYNNHIIQWMLPFMRALIILFAPITLMLTAISRLFSSPFGSDAQVNTITEEEIMTFVEGGTIEEDEKEMIYSVLQLDEKLVRDVMVPRIDVVALDIDSPVEIALEKFIKTGFSRIPVYDDIIDNIKGVLYAKDLLTHWHNGNRDKKDISSMIRSAYFVPETRPAHLLLQELKAKKVHIAIVVDEYGGTAGLVTIEDLIEQIIGDIQDEYDLNEEAEYVQIREDEFVVDAGINIEVFNDLLEVDLPSDESNTLGGFIYGQLGHIPEVGETITTGNLMLRVESLERRRIRKVYVHHHKQGMPPPNAPDASTAHASTAGTASTQEKSAQSDPPLPSVLNKSDKPLAYSN